MNRPGQIELNEFELAILERIADKIPSLRSSLGRLHVLSREFTGVGSYTKFRCEDAAGSTADKPVGLDDLIDMPNVPNGMGAVLFFQGGQPKCLETYTFGGQLWDGVYEGFAIPSSQRN